MKKKNQFSLPEGIELKEEGANIRMYLYRESFGIAPIFSTYISENETLFESYVIYLHIYQQKGEGQVILDVKGHVALPILDKEMLWKRKSKEIYNVKQYFFFLYRCFILQRQYDWFVLSDKIKIAVDSFLPFIENVHMTSSTLHYEKRIREQQSPSMRGCVRRYLAQDGRLRVLLGEEVSNTVYDTFPCLLQVFYKGKNGRLNSEDWLFEERIDLWGIKDGVLSVFVLAMQKEDVSIHRMLFFGNYMKDNFSGAENDLFRNRMANPNPPSTWHGWENARKIKVVLLTTSPCYECLEELLKVMNTGNEKTGIVYEFKQIPPITREELLEVNY